MADEDNSLDERLLDARLMKARQTKMSSSPNTEPAQKGLGERAFDSLQGFGSGLMEGTTAGEGIPVVGPLASKAGTAFGAAVQAPFSDKSFGQLYNEGRNREEAADAEYVKQNPVSSATKSLAGGMMLPAPGIGLEAAAAKAPGLIRGAAGIADVAAPNMATSYADTLLRSGDSDKAYDTAKDAGMLSGGLGALGKASSGVANHLLPQGLAGLAEERAFKAATGQSKKAFKEAYLKKARDLGRDASEGEVTTWINQIGRDLLSKDEAGGPVVGWFDSVKNIAPKAAAKRQYFGDQIGKVGSEVDNLVPTAVSGENIADRIGKYAETIPDLPSKQALRDKLAKEAEAYRGNGNLSFEDAQRYKNQYQFKPVDAGLNVLPQDTTNAMRGAVGQEMEDTVSKLAASPETSPEVKKQLELYTYLKSKYGSFKSAEKSANNKVLDDLSNRFVSPSDYGMGAAAGLGGMIAGHGAPLSAAIMGAGGAAANKLVRTRGNAFMARSLDTVDKVVNSPGAERFKPILEEAAKRGPQAVILTHEMLKRTDEMYKKLSDGVGP